MNTHPSAQKSIIWGMTLAALLLLANTGLAAQQLPAEVAQWGYPDTIFVNGKVVSMDDASTSNNVGSVYQAIAVKEDKIVRLGTNAAVRALAGPDTRIFDLKGRTLMPGIVEPHSHIYGRATEFLDRFGFQYPPDGIIVTAQADRDLEKTQAIMRDTIQEAVKRVKPGQWVVLQMQPHPEAPADLGLWGMTRRLTNRRTLDVWAPENPVLMRPGLRGNLNSKALEVMNDFLPGYSASIQETMHGDVIHEDIPELGWVGSQEMAVITWELFLEKVPLTTLAQALKLSSEDFAAKGVTTFSTRIPFPKVMSGYATLAGVSQMPIRLDAHYEVHRMPTDPEQTRQMYRRTGVLQGIGNDYFWIDGVASERWDSLYPESCTGADTIAPPQIKAREVCPKPGELPWDVLENAMKAGWRLAGVHICGSESARAFFRMVDRAREANGMSMEEVRQLKITGEHCDLIGKTPVMIQQLKNYGIMLSCGPDIIAREAPKWIADYGPQMNDFFLPFKTWIESDVQLVGQHWGSRADQVGTGNFRPPFYQPWIAVTRRFDGQVWQPEERIDRVRAIKMFTRWAAEYVRKPDLVGSLEVGKFADLLILDRDYFTIPVDDILKIHSLMTMVGGKMIVLREALANEFGVASVGPVYNFTDEDVEHIGKPLTEIARIFEERERGGR